jgi:hypothetical protein
MEANGNLTYLLFIILPVRFDYFVSEVVKLHPYSIIFSQQEPENWISYIDVIVSAS